MARIDSKQATFAGVLLLANRMQTHYDAALGEITLKQWLALTVVAALPQPVPSTAVVARALGTTHQNVTKLLTALSAKGLLTLAPSPEDRRARQVSLTPAAYAYFQRHEATGDRLLAELFAGIAPQDIATCAQVLDQMSRSLTGEGLTPPETEV
ncbi:MAG: MarR family transcriptional regulator [Propionibacteriaceae bacterium]|nr:MarR family transcriptional regulator [Propionibacteriaceae bacterium]